MGHPNSRLNVTGKTHSNIITIIITLNTIIFSRTVSPQMFIRKKLFEAMSCFPFAGNNDTNLAPTSVLLAKTLTSKNKWKHNLVIIVDKL
jgi:hypothetical protein